MLISNYTLGLSLEALVLIMLAHILFDIKITTYMAHVCNEDFFFELFVSRDKVAFSLSHFLKNYIYCIYSLHCGVISFFSLHRCANKVLEFMLT